MASVSCLRRALQAADFLLHLMRNLAVWWYLQLLLSLADDVQSGICVHLPLCLPRPQRSSLECSWQNAWLLLGVPQWKFFVSVSVWPSPFDLGHRCLITSCPILCGLQKHLTKCKALQSCHRCYRCCFFHLIEWFGVFLSDTIGEALITCAILIFPFFLNNRNLSFRGLHSF